LGSLKQKVEDRLHVTDSPVMLSDHGFVFDYEPDEFDTYEEYIHSDGSYTLERAPSLAHYMFTNPDNGVAAKIKEKMAEYYELNVVDRGWWLHPDESMEPTLAEGPTEQFIVGQGKKGIRVFNFGEEMDVKRQVDLIKFVDIATQYFGDEVFDLTTDIIISPKVGEDGNTQGFVNPTKPHAIFIDSNVLAIDESDNKPLAEEGNSLFLNVMVHELGHFLHGFNKKDYSKLMEFAEKTGWDVDGMLKYLPLWKIQPASKVMEYAPERGYMVKGDNGKFQFIDTETFEADFTHLKPEKMPEHYLVGSPTDYGEMNPKETSAETTAHVMLGRHVTHNMRETRDAWIEHMQKDGRVIAGPINRKQIILERRTGSDILYPVTELPDRIDVYPKPYAKSELQTMLSHVH
jgi:hypothetical protein